MSLPISGSFSKSGVSSKEISKIPNSEDPSNKRSAIHFVPFRSIICANIGSVSRSSLVVPYQYPSLYKIVDIFKSDKLTLTY
jgi:hypothetical protein